jgi:catechol 2,3-dioxygenase-like lactoylglutathione lyase family enzyme
VHPTLFVRDLATALDYYTRKLGFRFDFDWGDPPTFAGISLDKVQMFLAQGDPNPAGCQVFFAVGDADELHALHRRNGVKILCPPTDRAWAIRDYEVEDADGHRLIFGHYIPVTEPKLEIERVDVPVRLERRLAALLADLAAHKRMSVGETLEEMLLHSFEPLPEGGVASPHTDRTLAYIPELKRKHGIDYDCHASYRFAEKT